ncbi:hypothetical protein N7451_000997 [Penicillium sp. IBT 35674x]|nr:hypothetical protein N7451_000997 [Penicillium sp. IBT 35674x]
MEHLISSYIEFIAANKNFVISCTLAGLIAMIIPRTRHAILWFLGRMHHYRQIRPIETAVIQFVVIFLITTFLIRVNVLSNPPKVVYMLIDAENGTKSRISREEFSSISSRQAKASGFSGDEWAEDQAERVAAYYAESSERRFTEELGRTGYPLTTTSDEARATSML